jgi:hypothetical protein
VAQLGGCNGSVGLKWWLSGRDVMAQLRRIGGRTIGDVVAQCNGSVGLKWWLIGRNEWLS